MESPASWNETVLVIAAAIDHYRETVKMRMCGPSLSMTIYRALKDKGLLKEEE